MAYPGNPELSPQADKVELVAFEDEFKGKRTFALPRLSIASKALVLSECLQ